MQNAFVGLVFPLAVCLVGEWDEPGRSGLVPTVVWMEEGWVGLAPNGNILSRCGFSPSLKNWRMERTRSRPWLAPSAPSAPIASCRAAPASCRVDRRLQSRRTPPTSPTIAPPHAARHGVPRRPPRLPQRPIPLPPSPIPRTRFGAAAASPWSPASRTTRTGTAAPSARRRLWGPGPSLARRLSPLAPRTPRLLAGGAPVPRPAAASSTPPMALARVPPPALRRRRRRPRRPARARSSA